MSLQLLTVWTPHIILSNYKSQINYVHSVFIETSYFSNVVTILLFINKLTTIVLLTISVYAHNK